MSLTELLMAISVLGLLGSLAIPHWHVASTQVQLKSRAQALLADAQWAQSQAIRLGEPLALEPLTCPVTGNHPALDWSCGWQVVSPAAATTSQPMVLRQRQTSPQIRMAVFPAQTRWHVDAQGRWLVGALRIEWSTAQPGAKPVGVSVCASNAGRWRWQTGLGCST